MKYIQKIIASGYFLIALLIGCIAYTWYHEWQEVEALEVGNRRIDEFRKEVNPKSVIRDFLVQRVGKLL